MEPKHMKIQSTIIDFALIFWLVSVMTACLLLGAAFVYAVLTVFAT